MKAWSIKKKLASFLAVVLVFGSVSFPVSAAAPAANTLGKNTAERHVVCTGLSDQAEAYYTGDQTYEKLILLDGKKTDDSTKAVGSPLFNELQSMMQLKNTVSYTSLVDYFEHTDSAKGTTHALLFYGDTEASGAGAYNREHVWPKSHGNFVTGGAGADIHHIRPSDQTINSTRGNYTMGNVREKTGYDIRTKGYGGKTVLWYIPSYSENSCDGLVEVADNIKGDVARIYLYVYVAYGNANTNKNLFTKCGSYGSSSNDGGKVIESLDTLLEWNALDPVDEWEMRQNDLGETVQGNRNVFIDYPELAWYLFNREEEMPVMQTPSGNANGTSAAYTVQVFSNDETMGTVALSGKTVTAFPKEGYYVSGYQVTAGTAHVTRDGNAFRVAPSSDCTIRIDFAAKTTVLLTYLVNGAVDCTETVYSGDSVPLPDGIAPLEGWEFLGWSTESFAPTETKPEALYTESFTPLSDTIFYAVFSKLEGDASSGTGLWTKLTSESSLAVGTKIVFACPGYNALAGGLMAGKTVLESAECKTFTGDYIDSLPGNAMVFTVGGASGAWTFTSDAGQLYCNSVKELNFSENGTGTWKVSVSGGISTVTSTDPTKESLEYNASTPRFTTYAASSNQKKISIYFLDGTGGTVKYATEIDGHVHTLVHHDGQPATETEAGWEPYDTCTECDYTTYKEILPLGQETVITGDVNDDEKVDAEDAIRLLMHVMFPELYSVNQATDYNGDGVENAEDAIRLLMHVMFPELYALH